MTTETKVLTTYPTKKEITDFKEKYGADNIFDLSTEYEGKKYVLVMRRPEIRHIEMAQASLRKSGKNYDYDRSLINNCALAHTAEGMDIAPVFMAWAAAIPGIIEYAKVEVKNL